MPDLQSASSAWLIVMHHQWVLRITNPQLGYTGLQIQRDKVTKSALIRENLRFFLLSFH